MIYKLLFNRCRSWVGGVRSVGIEMKGIVGIYELPEEEELSDQYIRRKVWMNSVSILLSDLLWLDCRQATLHGPLFIYSRVVTNIY